MRLITELETIDEVNEILELAKKAKNLVDEGQGIAQLAFIETRKIGLLERVVNTVAKAPIYMAKQELRGIASTAMKLVDPDLWIWGKKD